MARKKTQPPEVVAEELPVNLISKSDLQVLLEREIQTGADIMKPGLKLALDILKYTPETEVTIWQAVRRKLSRKR